MAFFSSHIADAVSNISIMRGCISSSICTILFQTATYNKLQVSIQQNMLFQMTKTVCCIHSETLQIHSTLTSRWIHSSKSICRINMHQCNLISIFHLFHDCPYITYASIKNKYDLNILHLSPIKKMPDFFVQRKRAQLTSSISAVPTVLSCLTRFLFYLYIV